MTKTLTTITISKRINKTKKILINDKLLLFQLD